MKKFLFLMVSGFLIAQVSSVTCFAEDMQGGGMMDNGGQQGGDMGYSNGPMRRGGGPMMGKMMGMGGGPQSSVTALMDGGVVVLEGHRLIKYDKDLNFVNEVELKRGKPPVKNEMPAQDEQGNSNGQEPAPY